MKLLKKIIGINLLLVPTLTFLPNCSFGVKNQYRIDIVTIGTTTLTQASPSVTFEAKLYKNNTEDVASIIK
jgi:hypothetical protein